MSEFSREMIAAWYYKTGPLLNIKLMRLYSIANLERNKTQTSNFTNPCGEDLCGKKK